MTLLLVLLLHVVFIWPVSESGRIDFSDQQTPPNNYYQPGDYLISAVVPLRALRYQEHAFEIDPICDIAP